MPAPFQRLSVDQFAIVLKALSFAAASPVVATTTPAEPRHVEGPRFDGRDVALPQQDRGFSDIAQHLTIDPDGHLWTGRNWNLPPASPTGKNGTAAAGPFMFEIVGDFDDGQDALDGDQRTGVCVVVAGPLRNTA